MDKTQKLLDLVKFCRSQNQLDKQYQDFTMYNKNLGWGYDINNTPFQSTSFEPKTATEIPIFCIYLFDRISKRKIQITMEALWHLYKDPEEFEKIRLPFSTHHDHMTLLSQISETHAPGAEWVAVDFFVDEVAPLGYWEKEMAFDHLGRYLAHSEIMSAMVFCPVIAPAFGDLLPNPIMGGYCINEGKGQNIEPTNSPYIHRIPELKKVRIGSAYAGSTIKGWGCPRARKLAIQ